MTALRLYERRLSSMTGIVILVGLAIGGLFYVKWLPYYHKASLPLPATRSADQFYGRRRAGPSPSLKAALDYSLAYGKAIWQAMVLGLACHLLLRILKPAECPRKAARSCWMMRLPCTQSGL